MERLTKRINGVVTYIGYEPEEIPAAIQEAAKASEHNTACIMAEVIAGAMKDTIDKYCTPPVSSTL